MTRNLKPTRWLMTAMLPLLLGARGTGSATSVMDPLPESRIWVSGTSSVRGWECKASTFTATVDAAPNGAATVLAGEKAVTSVEVAIPTEKLECGNGQMNGHMRKALKAEEHSQITFRLVSYELSRSNDSLLVTMTGTLTIGGTEKPVELQALATAAPDGALRVSGQHQFKMTEFGLKPPKLMFGTMKVHDQVKVGFDVLLKDRAE